jgi:uncharacterized protein YcbK (DUF882 family)
MDPKIFNEQIKNFVQSEFPEPIEYGHPKLFYSLDAYRNLLGAPIYPSPSARAFVRTRERHKESMHYANLDQHIRSRAIDVFVDDRVDRAFMLAMASQLWGGVGVYGDTEFKGRPWSMLHLDIRPLGHGHSRNCALIWLRIKGEYTYPQYEEYGEALLFNFLMNLSKR